MEIFVLCVMNFEPNITKTCKAPHHDCQNLSHAKDEHTYGENVQKRLYKCHL